MQSFQGIFETCTRFLSVFSNCVAVILSPTLTYIFCRKEQVHKKSCRKSLFPECGFQGLLFPEIISRELLRELFLGKYSRELLFTKSADLLFNQRFILIEKISSQSETIYSEAYSGPCQTSKMELFAKKVNGFSR